MKKSFSRLLALVLTVALLATCAIAGFSVSAEEAEGTITEPTFGENLLVNETYTKTLTSEKDFYEAQKQDKNGNKLFDDAGNPLMELKGNDRGLDFGLDEPLQLGARYVVRFEARGLSTSVSPNPGKWSQNVVTTTTDEWVSYQTAFTVAKMTDYNKLWVSISLSTAELGTTGTFELRNMQLLYAPADGRFNLVHNGDMEMATAQNFLQAQINEGGAKIVDDPNGSDNKVLHLIKGGPGTTYNSLPNLFDEIDYSKAFKIKMRIYGYLRFDNWAGEDKYMNNPGALQSSGQYTSYYSENGWTTIEFFIDLKNNFQYLSLNNCNTSSTTMDLWIDDVEVYEIDPDGATDWTVAPTTKLDAVGNAMDMNQYAIVTEPANSSPYGDFTGSGYVKAADLDTGFTWTVAGGKTNYYDSTAQTFTGTEIDAVTVTNAGRATLVAQAADSKKLISLVNVNPTFTVTDGNKTMTTKVEWVYETHPIKNGNFEAGAAGWGGNNSSSGTTGRVTAGIGYDGSTGYMITSGTMYANQAFYLKPNSYYRVTAKVKSDFAATASFSAYSGGPYNATYTTKPSVSAANLQGKGWYTVFGRVDTKAAPCWGSNSFNLGPSGASAEKPVYVDDFVIELIEDEADIIIAGDFDTYSASAKRISSLKSGAVYSYVAPGSIEGGVGGNTSGMIKMLPGIAGGNATSNFQPDNYEDFQPNHVYKISFKHYGDAGKFTATTWSQTITAAGGGTMSMSATDTWKEYYMYYVPGHSMDNNGNWSYLFYFDSANATEGFYIDDFKVEEVNSVYTMRGMSDKDYNGITTPTKAQTDQHNMGKGTITLKAGNTSMSNSAVREVVPGAAMTVTVTANAGYLPIPGTLEVVTVSGKRTKIFNTAHTAMAGSDGTTFRFTAPEETAYVTCQYAEVASTQGYQWGTVATSVRHTEDGKYDGLRSLNRIYVDGLDWSADTLTTTVAGETYTIAEIGAIARVAADGEVTLDNAERKGLCYSIDDPNGRVKVLDYTDTYFDFSVVIAYKTPVESDATEYQWRAYMILEAADGSTQTVYTDMNTDSLDAAISRGA